MYDVVAVGDLVIKSRAEDLAGLVGAQSADAVGIGGAVISEKGVAKTLIKFTKRAFRPFIFLNMANDSKSDDAAPDRLAGEASVLVARLTSVRS
jgi:hypothetical protein